MFSSTALLVPAPAVVAAALAAPLRRARVLQQVEPQLFAVGAIPQPFSSTTVPSEICFPDMYAFHTALPHASSPPPQDSFAIATAMTSEQPAILPLQPHGSRAGSLLESGALSSAWVRTLPRAEERALMQRSSIRDVRRWLQASASTTDIFSLDNAGDAAVAMPLVTPSTPGTRSVLPLADNAAEARHRARMWARGSPWWGSHVITSLSAGVGAVCARDWLSGAPMWLVWPTHAIK